MFDNHVHSNFSGDSQMDAEAAIKRAIELGLKGISFTDHLDIDYPNYEDVFMIDFEKYNVFMDSLKYKYSNKIKIIKGIEIGIQPHVLDETYEIVNKYPFDFVIGSIHIVDKLDLHNNDFCNQKTKYESYLRYFQEVLYLVKEIDNFDVLGHIDLIRRYGNYENTNLVYDDFKEVLDEILSVMINKGKVLEINCSGYKYNLNSTLPDFDLVQRYKDLGGKYISVGSDAHYLEYVGYKFDEIKKRLKGIGFNQLVHFENRKMIIDDI
jgi:histidinol-phosphatase (PHP family)